MVSVYGSWFFRFATSWCPKKSSSSESAQELEEVRMMQFKHLEVWDMRLRLVVFLFMDLGKFHVWGNLGNMNLNIYHCFNHMGLSENVVYP